MVTIIKKHQEIYGNFIEMKQLYDNSVIIDFPSDNNNSNLFIFKQKIKGQTNNNWTEDVEIVFSLKYHSNFQRALEMSLIKCETSLMLTLSRNCFLKIAVLIVIQKLYFRKSKYKIYSDNQKTLCFTAKRMKFSIKDFFSECDQIRSFLRIWSHLLKKTLMTNLIFCAVFLM